jgi:hypothetical protein
MYKVYKIEDKENSILTFQISSYHREDNQRVITRVRRVCNSLRRNIMSGEGDCT